MLTDHEALVLFKKQHVSNEMIQYLVMCVCSTIKLKDAKVFNVQPINKEKIPPLTDFIKSLVIQSNVQTGTLMASAVYLKRLKEIIPKNVYGIETTRHRMFLGCLILAAKYLNDCSPMNKHWASFSNGLLKISEVNTIEREILSYLKWNINFTVAEMNLCIAPFIQHIREKDQRSREQQQLYASYQSSNVLLSKKAPLLSPSATPTIGLTTSPYSDASSFHSSSSSTISVSSVATSSITPSSSYPGSPSKVPVKNNLINIPFVKLAANHNSSHEHNKNNVYQQQHSKTHSQISFRRKNQSVQNLNTIEEKKHLKSKSLNNVSLPGIQFALPFSSYNKSQVVNDKHSSYKSHSKKSSWQSFFGY